jgi:Glutathione S-transferase, N-terminal domain
MTTLPSSLTSKDFFLGIAVSATVAVAYQLYRLFQEPSIEEMEARACAPMLLSKNQSIRERSNHHNEVAKSSSSSSSSSSSRIMRITIFGFNGNAGERERHAAADRGILDASPYVMYVELCCRMLGLAYTKVPAIPADARFRPRHKLPVAIIIGSGDDHDGVMLDDSRKIVQEIQKQQQRQQVLNVGNNKNNNVLSDIHLDDEQRAMARLVENTLCQSLFWSLLYNKFDTHRGRNVFRRQLVDQNFVPTATLRRLISSMAFRQMHAQLVGQGIARYPRAEVLEKARQDLAALSGILGSKTFILDKNNSNGNGDDEKDESSSSSSSPTFTDAMMYAMLVLVLEDEELQVDLCSTAKAAHPNLVAFVDRMRRRYIPEACGGGSLAE